MTILEIFGQLVKTYGTPNPTILFENTNRFREIYSPRDPPEILFKRIEDCQEIAVLGDDPFTAKQFYNNIIHLLTKCGAFTLELREWAAKPAADKTYLALKNFIQSAYARNLNNGTPLMCHEGVG